MVNQEVPKYWDNGRKVLSGKRKYNMSREIKGTKFTRGEMEEFG